ncbi:TetR/AcrR family transcriptional regulator [Nocardia sp. NPDC003979]
MRDGLRAFADLGYEAVSVRELNERLGMGHTFIHDRYGSKEAFWRAVIGHEAHTLATELAPTLAVVPDDDLRWLVDAVRAFHRASAHHPYLNQVIDYEAARETDRLDYLYTVLEPVEHVVRPVFERLVAAGRIRAMPWHVFHFVVTKPALMYGQEPWARRFGRPDGAEDSAAIADVVLHGLLT